MLLLTIWALTAAAYSVYSGWRCWLQRPFILHFPPVRSDFDGEEPFVSVIVAARNEERSIAATLQSLSSLTYPRYEVIVVDDRSEDGTWDAIQTFIQKRDGGPSLPPSPVIQAVRLQELPPGWLGKNHALYQGYRLSRGACLLFTDADIRFRPDALASAVSALRSAGAAHVTAAPRMLTPGFWLGAFVRFFLYSLGLFVEPWLANDDRRRDRSMGVGAFNLLTREAYDAVGTHHSLAFRPDDDLRLGQLIKSSGRIQRFLSGGDMLEVEWYPNLREAIRGLEKNMFSGFRYRYGMAAAAAAGQLFLFTLPLPAAAGLLAWGTPAAVPAAVLFFTSYLMQSLLYLLAAGGLSGGRRKRMLTEALTHPVTAALLAFVIVRSVLLAGLRGGVYWRGTFYTLEELRKHE